MKKQYSRQCLCLAVWFLFFTDVSGALAVEGGQSPIPVDDVAVVSSDLKPLPTIEKKNGKTYLTITASRVPEKSSEVSANLTLIDRTEIDRIAADNVGDLLAEKGIGHVQKYPGALTTIGIRGFRTETHGNDLQGHVLILLDGRRAGTGNLAKIMTRNVERIEIIRGPGAVQYGSGGMGGVVNIITRQGRSNSAFIEGGGGSFGQASGNVGGTAKGQGFDFAGAVSSATQEDYKTASGITFVNTGFHSQTGVSANTGYEFAPRNRVGVIVTYFEASKVGNPGYLSATDTDNYTDTSNYSVDSFYRGQNSSGSYQWMIRYFFGKDDNRWVDPMLSNPTGWDDSINSRNKTDQQGAQAQISGAFGPLNLTTGLDWLHYAVENSWSPQQTSYTNPALFLLAKIGFLADTLIVSGGVRQDWYAVEVQQPNGSNVDDSHFTPQIGLAWMTTDAFKLRGQVGQGFVMPSADQLAIDMVAFGRRTIGNPNLNPEKSLTWEGGADYTKSGFCVSFTWFGTDFKNKIVTNKVANDTNSYINLGSATINGLEAALSYDLGPPLHWAWEVRPFVEMTLLNKYKDDATDLDLTYMSDLTLSTGLSFSDSVTFSGRINVSYTGQQQVDDWEDTYGVIEKDSFVVTDLTLSYRFWKDAIMGDFMVRGELRNLFDQDYAYVKGYPMPGRSLFVSLKWEY
ncbi:MAG: TonB-dependent receptor [Proteobacteria bacterium]|nr:TonB-dependent receptor [Pseudomonadota bacterium]MBU1059245.1 TonB-dependent receptor [Pseudomonadota bacterium]